MYFNCMNVLYKFLMVSIVVIEIILGTFTCTTTRSIAIFTLPEVETVDFTETIDVPVPVSETVDIQVAISAASCRGRGHPYYHRPSLPISYWSENPIILVVLVTSLS